LKTHHSLQQVLKQTDWCKQTNAHVTSVFSKLTHCRTASLGYHHYRCDNPDCSHIHYQYHSCRNRHCPNCNWQKQQAWMEARMNELLPVKYFHVVFTLPHELNALVMGNRVLLFKQLFDSAAHCLLSLSHDPKWLGATPSITAVLHTWGQQLSFHPHVHCIVSGGGVDKKLNWHEMKKKSYQGYLFPYDVMEPLFKKHFLQHVNSMISQGKLCLMPDQVSAWSRLKDALYRKQWVVYAKPPMGDASQVVEYLSRYAHKVAISNHRILEVTRERVLFQYKDYNDRGITKQMWLSKQEFLSRYAQHILPRGFVKMRHYGILANAHRRTRINLILQKMNLPPHPVAVKVPFRLRILECFGVDIELCPKCQKGQMRLMGMQYPNNRGSPIKASISNTLN
jgi:hypothetical protein